MIIRCLNNIEKVQEVILCVGSFHAYDDISRFPAIEWETETALSNLLRTRVDYET